MDKKFSVCMVIGFALVIFGGMLFDSESVVIPYIMCGAGIVSLIVGLVIKYVEANRF